MIIMLCDISLVISASTKNIVLQATISSEVGGETLVNTYTKHRRITMRAVSFCKYGCSPSLELRTPSSRSFVAWVINVFRPTFLYGFDNLHKHGTKKVVGALRLEIICTRQRIRLDSNRCVTGEQLQ
jgi:hypothetical protein